MPKLRTRPRMRLPARKRPTDRLIVPQMPTVQMETAPHHIPHEGQAMQQEQPAPRTRLLLLASIGAGGLVILLVTLFAFAAIAR